MRYNDSVSTAAWREDNGLTCFGQAGRWGDLHTVALHVIILPMIQEVYQCFSDVGQFTKLALGGGLEAINVP